MEVKCVPRQVACSGSIVVGYDLRNRRFDVEVPVCRRVAGNQGQGSEACYCSHHVGPQWERLECVAWSRDALEGRRDQTLRPFTYASPMTRPSIV
jgi:hypothetical protein